MQSTLSSRDTYTRGIGLVALAGTIWGTIGPVTQLIFSISATTPLTVSFFRVLFAAPLLVLVCYYFMGARTFRIQRRDLGIMLLIGATTAISQVSYLVAIPLAGVTIPTLVGVCTVPLSTAIFSVLLRLEPFSRRVMLALVGAIIGTALVVGIQPGAELPRDVVSGVFFSLLSGVTHAVSIMGGRALARRAHPLQINMVSFSTSALFLFGVALLGGGFQMDIPVVGWLFILYLGAVPTALAYGLFVAGMKTTPATIAGIITLLEPLAAAILAWIFFGERLTALGIVGAALLLASIYILTRPE